MATDLSEREALAASIKSVSKRAPEMKELENILICSICYEMMTNPTSTPCLHVFCSLCLRKYLQFKQECPSCYAELHEKSLRLDKTAEKLLGILPSLVKRFTDGDIRVTEEKVNSRESPEEKENHTPNKPVIVQSVLETSSLSSRPEVASGSKDVPVSARSSCPVCHVDIPTPNLSHHVERCLKAKDPERTLIKKPRPNPLPKLVYTLFKEKDLRTKCREYGLNARGEKNLLISRLKKYTLLFNDNVASVSPKSPLELKMQVEKEEMEEKAAKVARPEVLHYDRNSSQKEIEEKQKTYMRKNKDSFSLLKQKIKMDRLAKTEPSKEVLSNKNLNLIETVENLEDISNRDEEDHFIVSEPRVEHISKVETSVGNEVSNETAESSKTKRKSSPLKSPPNKKMKSKNSKTSKNILSTPMRIPVGDSSRSSAGNIFDKLTLSAEQNKKKLSCPVCGSSVAERFLNIHLDKCLESGKEDSRNVTKETQRKSLKKSVREDVSSDDSDFESFNDDGVKKSFFFSDRLSQKEKREKLKRVVVKPPIVEASQSYKGDVDHDGEEEKNNKKEEEKEDSEWVPSPEGIEEEDDKVQENALDETASLPSSPLLGPYTDTLSQNSDLFPPRARTPSKDMFESSDDDEDEDNRPDVSIKLDDHIEERLEAALNEREEESEEKGSQQTAASEGGTKRVSLRVIPRTRSERSSQEPVRRSSRIKKI